MSSLTVLMTVCLASSSVLAASVLDKPYYNLEDAGTLFENFLKEHKKTYNQVESLDRFEIFKESLKDINSRNALHPRTVFALNRFADLTAEERQQYQGFRLSNDTMAKVTIPDGPVAAPDQLDWRQKGVVSHVKDQGQCGSCYIFSAVGNIEGQYAIKHQQCLAFSEGQAMDCTYVGGCKGGWPHDMMNALAQRTGLMKEEDYPYITAKGACHEDASKVAGHVQKGVKLDIPDEETLKQKLSEIGPLSVALDATDLQFYAGGILHPQNCKPHHVDHAVLLVGYGEESGEKFWIVKNSWGTKWGEQGYFKLLRGINACGMGTDYTASSTVA